MIEGLKPYAEYRESGQAWLGRVPAHWRSPRLKTVLREKEARSLDGAGLLLSLTRNRGLIARSDMTEKIHSARTLAGYKLYEPGEIVMNRMQAWSGMFGAGNKAGLVSPDYAVFKLCSEELATFLLARIKAPDLVSQFALESKGIGSGFNRLYSDRFGAISISLPPPDEQAAIVRFLDHANRKIDGFIRAKRKLIGLLNEQKQAIIHRAVTRGLDPDTPLKPSGVPWLGDIPRHWEIVRNMALFAHRVESGISGLPVLQVSLRSGISAEELDQFGRPKKLIADARKYKRIYQGDVAYNTMRMWQGAVGVSPCDGLVSPAYVVLKARQDTCPVFYDFVFHTEVYKQQVNRQSTGIVSDRNRLYWDSFKEMPNLTLPRAEQEDIVAFIVDRTTHLNTAIARTEREIALMQEYRTRLTADIVTGKLDVREAAATLPELPTGPAAEAFADEAPGDSDMLDEIEPEES